jgi:hypothetical protein
MRVVESLFVPEFIEGHRQERKWAHRVMWQRNRRFKITMVRGLLMVGGVAHMHPNTYKILKDQLK